MNHPTNATLALYAGDDLGLLAHWRTERHVARCERCREEVDVYSDIRAELPPLAEMPDVAWNRLAGEMKANIRLGLAAGECVRNDRELAEEPISWLGTRALVAYASIAALVTASVLLERPAPRLRPPAADTVTLQATSDGIVLEGGGQALSLMHRRAGEVTFSANTQGSMRARYVDSDTGNVTINNVYAQ